MAIQHNKYTQSVYNAYTGAITDLSSGSTEVKVALLASSYTPNLDTHDNWTDVSGDEISGDGYTSGGEVIANHSFAANGDSVVFDGDDVSWPDSTITARYAVIYDDTPVSAGDKKLLSLVDFDEDFSSQDGPFTIEWDADGIWEITRNAV